MVARKTSALKLNLKKDAGTSFEYQEYRRMIKTKFGNKNVFFEVFTEGKVATAITKLPTGKASV